ncbi:MAG: hypothetical protein J7605_12820 [Variovorax sp.]|nr:hypothetical protein [Variovorax sp.]
MVGRCNFIKGGLALSLAFCMAGYGHARTVLNLQIETTGQSDESLQNEAAARACRKFRPTQNQLVQFFNRAYAVEAAKIMHDRYSPCYATGKLRFSDGYFGEWVMYSSGVARFTFNGGDVVYLYHRGNRWYDPNACTYGLADEGEC